MGKKPKIAVFVDGDFIPSYDGASNRFHYLSRHLARSGADLIVFHGYRGWSDVSLIRKEPFKTYLFPIGHYYGNLELIASILIREGVDIIQFDNLEPILLQGVKLAHMTGARLVSEMHYVVRNLARKLGADEERLLEIEKIEKEVGRSVDHLICLSEQDKPLLAQYLELDPKRISVVPSGVDLEEVRYHGSNPEGKNIVFLGNLYFKPNEDAVRVIKENVYPKLRGEGFRFTITGDCPPNLAAELGDEGFAFVGTIPDLNDLFKDAAFALAPVSEGTGMRIKLLNYLAAGVPVITTSVATDGFSQKSAFIIEDDFSKYADIILQLLGNKRALKKISKKGYRIIKKMYGWDSIAKQTMRVYKRLVREKAIEKQPKEGVLQTSEPVWLQEAVSKKRFKQVANPDLPQNYSYCVIEHGEIKPNLIERIIALEGMAGAGKTTFISNYVKDSRVNFLPQLEIKNNKILLKDNLKTSKRFLMAEQEKSVLLESFFGNSRKVVVDRTFLTTMAYCYARSKMNGNGEYEKFVEFYGKMRSRIVFPTSIIFLDVDSAESIGRRKEYSANPNYANWFNVRFLDLLREFYRVELPRFIKVGVYYLDTTRMSAAEVEEKLKKFL